MDRSELIFRDGCRKWHAYFERCANGGRVAEIPHLIRKIAQYLDAWKDNLAAARRETQEAERRVVECRRKEASIQLRLRMLGQLSATMDRAVGEQERLNRVARRERALAADAERRSAEEERRAKDAKERRRGAERTKQDKGSEPGGDNE